MSNSKNKDESRHYVKNNEILPEIRYYVETGIATEKFGQQIMMIARNLAKKGNYNQYTWLEDMIGEAVLTCLKYSRNFDPDKSQNPFAYLSTICDSAFKGYLNKQRKHSKIKDACYKTATNHLSSDLLSEENSDSFLEE